MVCEMRKTIIFVVIVVALLMGSSCSLAAKPDSPPGLLKEKNIKKYGGTKPDSPPGLSKEKNVKAPGQWKKINEYESQKHFVFDIHNRTLSRLADRNVFPPGLIRIVNNFLLALGMINNSSDKEILEFEISGDVELSEEGNITLQQLMDSLNGTDGEHELNLLVNKQNDTISIETNETTGNLTIEQQDLWNHLVDIVLILVEEADSDDAKLEIGIVHQWEIVE
jgi:hypothetical protein